MSLFTLAVTSAEDGKTAELLRYDRILTLADALVDVIEQEYIFYNVFNQMEEEVSPYLPILVRALSL